MNILKNFRNPWEAATEVLKTSVLETGVLEGSVLGEGTKIKLLEDGSEDDYTGRDEYENDPPEIKKQKRIKQEIAFLQKKYPEKSLMELQNLVAVKFQHKNWYRGGKTRGNTATYKSKTTGDKIETIMVWKLYDAAPIDLFDTEGNREKFPINEWHTINLDPTRRFKEGTMRGGITITFDDLNIPDRLTVEAIGIEPIVFGYGDEFNFEDNVFITDPPIDASKLKSLLFNIKIEHPEGNGLDDTNYSLTIKGVNLIGELKELKDDYFISRTLMKDGKF